MTDTTEHEDFLCDRCLGTGEICTGCDNPEADCHCEEFDPVPCDACTDLPDPDH